jgi:ATP-dependent RNA helicase DOB1
VGLILAITTQLDHVSELLKSEEEYRKIVIPREEEVGTYYRLRTQLTALAKEFKSFITKPKYIIPFLQPGRMIHVSYFWNSVLYMYYQ